MTKTVIITGASSGIGKATAHYFAQKGWNVAATMRSPQKEQDLTKYPNIKLYRLDVTEAESISEAFNTIYVDYGHIDVLINNAGYGADGVFEAMSDDVIRKQFDTNVFGLMRTTREAIPYMRNNKSGTIIQISSVGGRVTFPLYSIYHGTKWAVEGFSESLHYELKQFGIAVKLIEPGAIKTDFYGRSRVAVPGHELPEYKDFVQKCEKLAMETGNNGIGPEAVAKVIYKAATDGKSKMRYSVGYPAPIILPLRKLLPEWLYLSFVKMSYKI